MRRNQRNQTSLGHIQSSLLIAVLLAVCAPAQLLAQLIGLADWPPSVGTDGLFPGPIRTQELRATLYAANASNRQILAATDALEAHHQAYHDLHGRVLRSGLLEHTTLVSALLNRTLPPQNGWPRLQREIQSARKQIRALDDALFTELEAILAKEQHAALLMLRHRRLRDAIAVQVPALLAVHHLLDPDLEGALAAAAPNEAVLLQAQVWSAMQDLSARSITAVNEMMRAAPPGNFDAAFDRAKALGLLTDHPATIDEEAFVQLRAAMSDALAAQRSQRAAAFQDLSGFIIRAAETIAAELPDDTGRRFMNRVHLLRHPQLLASILAIPHEVDRLIDLELQRSSESKGDSSDLLDLLVHARDRLAPIAQQAVRAADESASIVTPSAGEDRLTTLQHHLRHELPTEMSAVMTDLNDAYLTATGSPLPAPPIEPQPPSEPRDDPSAAALGAERMADLPHGAFLSLDWALPPPIRTVHATRWSRLLNLGSEDAQHLRSMIAAHRAQSVEQPAHRALQRLAQRMERPLDPTEGWRDHILTVADLPTLARARRAAIASMLAMDETFFADLRGWLGADELDDIVHMLELDRRRELSTTPGLIVTGRRRSMSLAWKTSPVMLLAQVEDVQPDTLHTALRAAERHIPDITEHARQLLHHRIIVAQGDDERFLHSRFGHVIDDDAVTERIAAPLTRMHTARRALRHSLGAALDAMCAALPDSAAISLMTRFRREAYPWTFGSMPDLNAALHAALQSADQTDPKRDALTDLLVTWREQSDRLNDMLTDLIEQSEKGATAPIQPTDETAERLEEFSRRLSTVFLQMLRNECDARALLRLDAIMGQ